MGQKLCRYEEPRLGIVNGIPDNIIIYGPYNPAADRCIFYVDFYDPNSLIRELQRWDMAGSKYP